MPRLLAPALALLALAAAPSAALATDISVTSNADSGGGTLRDSVAAANAGDRVLIPAGMTITLTSGAIVTDVDLTIEGAAEATSIVAGGDADRVFRSTAGDLTLKSMTIRDGAVAPATFQGGGCVAMNTSDDTDVLRLTNVTITECAVTGSESSGGGGVYTDGQDIIITDSTITATTVDVTNDLVVGGAIYNGGGDTTVTGSEISGNSVEVEVASPDNSGGGAIYANGGDLISITSTVIRDNHVTVTAAPGSTNGSGSGGGAIYAEGTFSTVITDSAIDENTATITEYEPSASGGGAIYSDGGDVTLQDSSVSVNDLTLSKLAAGTGGDVSGGGAIYLNGGDVALVDSTIADNDATLTNGQSSSEGGGAIYSNGGGYLFDGSTLSGNTLTMTVSGAAQYNGGGGFYGYTTPGSAATNSTFSGNSAQITGGGTMSGGGAILMFTTPDQGLFTNVTVAGNTTNREGSGFLVEVPPLKNTIVSNAGADCVWDGAPQDISEGHNLENGDTCNLAGEGDKTGTDPLLKPLANYGGITETHDLQDGSPALDAGAGCPAGDQRGLLRPFGPACDIGSVESGSSTAAPVDPGGDPPAPPDTGGGSTPPPPPPPPPGLIVCGGSGSIVPECLGQIPRPDPVITCGPSFGTILRSCEGLGLRRGRGGRPIGLDAPIPVEIGCGPDGGARTRQFGGSLARICRVSLDITPGLGSIVDRALVPKLNMGGALSTVITDALAGLGDLRSLTQELGGQSSLLSDVLKVPNVDLGATLGKLAEQAEGLAGLEELVSQIAVAPPGRRTALAASAQRRAGGLFGSIGRIADDIAGGLGAPALPGIGGVLSETLGKTGVLSTQLDEVLRKLSTTARQDTGRPADPRGAGVAFAAQANRRARARRLARRLVLATATVTIPYGTKRTVLLRPARWARPLFKRARGRSLPVRFSAVLTQNGSTREVAKTVKVKVRGKRR